jgi:hypothetical protein
MIVRTDPRREPTSNSNLRKTVPVIEIEMAESCKNMTDAAIHFDFSAAPKSAPCPTRGKSLQPNFRTSRDSNGIRGGIVRTPSGFAAEACFLTGQPCMFFNAGARGASRGWRKAHIEHFQQRDSRLKCRL